MSCAAPCWASLSITARVVPSAPVARAIRSGYSPRVIPAERTARPACAPVRFHRFGRRWNTIVRSNGVWRPLAYCAWIVRSPGGRSCGRDRHSPPATQFCRWFHRRSGGGSRGALDASRPCGVGRRRPDACHPAGTSRAPQEKGDARPQGDPGRGRAPHVAVGACTRLEFRSTVAGDRRLTSGCTICDRHTAPTEPKPQRGFATVLKRRALRGRDREMGLRRKLLETRESMVGATGLEPVTSCV